MNDKQKQYIIENYDKISIREMAKNIGVGRNRISKFMKENGLKIKCNINLTKEEQQFIIDNYGRGYEFLSKELNRNINTVKGFCNRNNIKASSFRDYNDVVEEISNNKEYFKKQLQIMTMDDLASMYGICKKTLYKIMKDLDIPKKTQLINEFNLNNEIKLNEDYFEIIDINQKAYFLGLIASDGCVYIPKDNRNPILSITLLEEDSYILDVLYSELNADKHPITLTYKNNRRYSQLQISSYKISEDLKKYGIIPNKTYEGLIIKNIPYEYYDSFLLGYFDGDGSISTYNDTLISSYSISICGIETAIDSLSKILNYKQIKHKIVLDNRKYDERCGKFSNITFSDTVSKYIFLKEIYKNNDVISLTRKKEISKKLIYNIEQNITNRSENIIALEKYKIYLDAVSSSNI